MAISNDKLVLRKTLHSNRVKMFTSSTLKLTKTCVFVLTSNLKEACDVIVS